MNSQLFTAKLAEKTKYKEVEVSIFIETFVLGFATKLQTTKKASFDPFGVFEVNKKVEYIEQRQDGSKVLCPPRLEVQFSSSAILGVLKLSELKENQPIYTIFAQRYEWEEEEVALFISQIKSVIKSQLLKDRISAIPGFGVFEGELGGDITFTADKKFAKQINKPFSHFKAVELSVSETDLTSVAGVEALSQSTQATSTSEGEADTDYADEVLTSSSVSEEVAADCHQESNDQQVATLKAIEPANEPVAADSASKEPASKEDAEAVAAAEETAAADIEEEIEVSDEEVCTVPEASAQSTSEPQDNEAESAPISVEEPLEEPSSADLIDRLKNKLGAYDNRLTHIEENLKSKDQSLRHYKRLAVFLGVLVLGLLIFWYWSFQLNQARYKELSTVDVEDLQEVTRQAEEDSGAQTPVLSDSVERTPVDSLTLQGSDSTATLTHAETLALQEDKLKEQDSLQVAKQAELPTKVEQKNRPSIQTKEVYVKSASQVIQHQLKFGETLRGLSLRYYNTKEKWEVILEANKDRITNPDVIPEGTLLIIPKLD